MEKVKMELEFIGNTNREGWDCNQWLITLRYNNKEIETDYYTGFAISEPTVEDVLSSLIMDSKAKDYSSFESWAKDFEIDIDSRKGEKIYKLCLENADKIDYLLGDDKSYFEEMLEDY